MYQGQAGTMRKTHKRQMSYINMKSRHGGAMKSSMPNCRSCRLQQVVTLKFDTGRHVQKFEAGYLKCEGTPSFFFFFVQHLKYVDNII